MFIQFRLRCKYHVVKSDSLLVKLCIRTSTLFALLLMLSLINTTSLPLQFEGCKHTPRLPLGNALGQLRILTQRRQLFIAILERRDRGCELHLMEARRVCKLRARKLGLQYQLPRHLLVTASLLLQCRIRRLELLLHLRERLLKLGRTPAILN